MKGFRASSVFLRFWSGFCDFSGCCDVGPGVQAKFGLSIGLPFKGFKGIQRNTERNPNLQKLLTEP